MGYIVEGKDNQQSSSDEYPLHLRYERDGLTGKRFGWCKKGESKPYLFTSQPEAERAARSLCDQLNKKWGGMKEFVFQVTTDEL